MSDLSSLGEFGLIRALTDGLPDRPFLHCGPGDDCGVIGVNGRQVLLSCDAMVEGIHFRRDWASPEDIGWKAVAAALSDIAAMGGYAMSLLITLGCVPDTDAAYLKRVYAGIAAAAREYRVVVAGGDTVRMRAGLMLDVMVMGVMDAEYAPRFRSDARPGDVVAVTGHPGSSALGMAALERGDTAQALLIEKHLRPRPRLAAGAWLAKQRGVHAMIDLSDGLAQDMGHIATRSRVCIALESDRLPVSPEMRAYAAVLGCPPERYALSGGEDYELALTLSPGVAEAVCARFSKNFDIPIACIGQVRKGAAETLVDEKPVVRGGFDHFAGGK